MLDDALQNLLEDFSKNVSQLLFNMVYLINDTPKHQKKAKFMSNYFEIDSEIKA